MVEGSFATVGRLALESRFSAAAAWVVAVVLGPVPRKRFPMDWKKVKFRLGTEAGCREAA